MKNSNLLEAISDKERDRIQLIPQMGNLRSDNSVKKLSNETKFKVNWLDNDYNVYAGYGACRSCDCQGYVSRNDGTHACKVCRHDKSQHR